MSVDAAFLDHLGDLLAGLGPIGVKRMFGGAGLYSGDLIFAIVIGDVLYLKTDSLNRADFEGAGSRPFAYEKGGSVTDTSYWSLPDSAMDDPDEAAQWARLALEAARRKPAKPKRPATGR